MIRPAYDEEDGWTFPAGWPKWLRNLIETWHAARNDPSSGELTHGQHGDWTRWHLEHGWWLTPGDWGLGVSIVFDLKDRPYMEDGGRVYLAVEFGAASWSLTLCQPYIARTEALWRTIHEAYCEVYETLPEACWQAHPYPYGKVAR